MTHEYKIEGMSCMSCVAKVKSSLLKSPNVLSADVDKATDTATVEMSQHVSIDTLQKQLKDTDPKYSIMPLGNHINAISSENTSAGLTQYKPIFLIFAYILTVTLTIQFLSDSFNSMQWMHHFMAGFFLVFSFFKILDLSGFANSYMSYDIIAKVWKNWGYVYAFVELGLGLAYLTNCCPLATNIAAFIIMTISIIGVLQSVFNKKKIQCACLGAVFDLPMSTVTIIEDALMIIMSGYMILNLI
jgi:cation transport ATPase